MNHQENTTDFASTPESHTELNIKNSETTVNFVRSLKSSTEIGMLRWQNIYNIAMFRFPDEYQNYLLADFADETGRYKLNYNRCFYTIFDNTHILFLDVIYPGAGPSDLPGHHFEILLGQEGVNGYLTHMPYDDVYAASDESLQAEIGSLCHFIEKYMDSPENRAFTFMQNFVEHSANW